MALEPDGDCQTAQGQGKRKDVIIEVCLPFQEAQEDGSHKAEEIREYLHRMTEESGKNEEAAQDQSDY